MRADVIYISGNLRANQTVCYQPGSGVTCGPSDPDSQVGQFAAAVYSFDVVQTTTMQVLTYSYGGGTSLTGAAVSAGGFTPYLTLFDGSGNFLASVLTSGTLCPAGANSYMGSCDDWSMDGGTLTPGPYQIAISAYENMSLAEQDPTTYTLADGFTGLGNLDGTLNYGFDIILPQQITPEPSSFGLILILTPFLRRRRKQA